MKAPTSLLSRWRDRRTKRAYRILCDAMRRDTEFAVSWHDEIVKTLRRDGVPHMDVYTDAEASYVAARLMWHLFDVPAPPK